MAGNGFNNILLRYPESAGPIEIARIGRGG